MAWSAYIILGWQTHGKVKAAPLNAISGAFGAAFCFIIGAASGGLEVYAWSSTALYGFLYLTLCSGLIAFMGWNWAVLKVGASKAGAFVYIVPLFGLAWLYTGRVRPALRLSLPRQRLCRGTKARMRKGRIQKRHLRAKSNKASPSYRAPASQKVKLFF